MWECGLKQLDQKEESNDRCHSLCGSVDWNNWHLPNAPAGRRHSLCGSVDWNNKNMGALEKLAVTPYVGVWIETLSDKVKYYTHAVTPYVGVWIETCP